MIDLETGKEIDAFRDHKGCVLSLSLSADGKKLVSGGVDRVGRVWDTATGKVTARFFRHTSEIDIVRIASTGNWVASVGGEDDDASKIQVWNASNGDLLATIEKSDKRIAGLDIAATATGIVFVRRANRTSVSGTPPSEKKRTRSRGIRCASSAIR